MSDAGRIALLYIALTALCLVVYVSKRRRARKSDDLMAVHDAVKPPPGVTWEDTLTIHPHWHDDEIEQLRALFHADQTPQPERRH